MSPVGLMRAILSHEPGGPETLVYTVDAIVPEPAPTEVRIRVHATALNFPDLLRIEDRYQERAPRPFAPGSEVSGVIEKVGSQVRDLQVGQRVMGMGGWGGLAEFACVAQHRVSAIPDTMNFEEAAAFLVTYGTGWHALKQRADLRPGEVLLVLGASGGVGLAAIELGKAMGARVVAAASTPEKLKIATEAGADAVVAYPTGDLDETARKALSKAFKAACGGGGASVVFDPVGGAYAEPAFRALDWGGRHLVIGFATGIASLPMNLPLLKGASLIGVFWGDSVERDPAGHQVNVKALLEMYQKGLIRPSIHGRWPLDRAPEALALLASRQATGKLIVLP